MSNLEIRTYIEDKLKTKFIKDQEKEWVNVHIDVKNQNFINIKIVSDHIGNRREFKSYVKNLIDNYPEYKMGTIRIYSVEEADEYEIVNTPSKNRPSNLVEAIDYMNNSYEINNNKKFKSEVISFYSYKGGVGRTLALIHTAYLLAKRGKNVLMLDLDIEAPSMQNIFKSEMEEIDYGLIDYLYNKIYEKGTEKKITIPDIYVKVDGSKEENISGNLYVIPAGKLNTEYIYKLSKIQPNLVSRNNYISDLIKDLESKQELNLDFVLVDSRTGINDWGGLSLIDVSDRVVFFVYPNNENMEGSRALMNLVENSKKGNISVVFSRVDVKAHDDAVKFFDELDLDQDYVEITYDSDIALSKRFPVEKMLTKCESVVDMILDSESIDINKQILSKFNNYKKKEILSIIKKFFDEEFIIRKDSLNSEKIEEDNIYLVVSKSQDLLNKYIELLPKERTIVDKDNREGLNQYNYNNIIDYELFESLQKYLKSYKWMDLWHAYIVKLINDHNNVILELLNKNISFYLEYIKEVDIAQLYIKIIDKQKEGQIKKEDHNELSNVLLKGAFKNIYNQITIFINNSSWLNDELMLECLKALKLINVFFESNNINISVKIFKQDDVTIYKRNILKELKSNILNLEWKKKDIQDFINKSLYMLLYMEGFEPYKKLLNLNENNLDKFIVDLFLGRKVVVNNKKVNTIDYFCEKLEEIDKFNVIDTNEILVKAIDFEIENGLKMNDRIISQDSLEKAFEFYNN